MNGISYDVRIWGIEIYRGAKVTTYTVRWKVSLRRWRRSFRIAAQADSFRAELLAAARRGEAFATETGLPASWRRENLAVGWYDFTCGYVDMKWRPASANTASDRPSARCRPARHGQADGGQAVRFGYPPCGPGLGVQHPLRPSPCRCGGRPDLAVAQHPASVRPGPLGRCPRSAGDGCYSARRHPRRRYLSQAPSRRTVQRAAIRGRTRVAGRQPGERLAVDRPARLPGDRSAARHQSRPSPRPADGGRCSAAIRAAVGGVLWRHVLLRAAARGGGHARHG